MELDLQAHFVLPSESMGYLVLGLQPLKHASEVMLLHGVGFSRGEQLTPSSPNGFIRICPPHTYSRGVTLSLRST